MKFKVAIS